MAGGDGTPPGCGDDDLGGNSNRRGVACAKLAVAIVAPTPQRSVGLDRTCMIEAATDLGPVGAWNLGRIEAHVRGPVPELAIAVVAPTPQAVIHTESTAVEVAGCDGRPARRQPWVVIDPSR